MAATATAGDTMKAVVREKYGPPDVLELREVEKPELANDGVLVWTASEVCRQVRLISRPSSCGHRRRCLRGCGRW
jgi:hypothetical protein